MAIRCIKGNDLKKIEPLFKDWNETLIWSCLQRCMGTAWSDFDAYEDGNPPAAQVIIADFCFFAGKPDEKLVRNKPKDIQSDFIIMVPQNEEWSKLIEQIYGAKAKKVTRYAIKKENDNFNKEYLENIVHDINPEYELQMINQEIYNLSKEERWSSDLCSQFKIYEDYKKNGIGVAALHKGQLVAGASSYTYYRDGIEIEIDTKEEYRRNGLALACGAKLILECLNRNIYPSWDAQNRGSVALAERLGYHYDYEYPAFEVEWQ